MDVMTNPAAAPITTPNRKTNGKTRSLMLIGIAIALALIIIIGIILFMAYQGNKTSTATTNNTLVNVIPSNVAELSMKPTLEVMSPIDNSTVNGKIDVSGKLTSTVGKLTVTVSDDTGVMLGQSDVTVDATQKDAILDWTSSVDVVVSPQSKTGSLKISAIDSSFSYLTQTIKVNFEEQTADDRVKLTAPLVNQVMYTNDVYFVGQMQNFFEGTMGIRLKDEDNNVIYTGSINASGDNNGQYANFSQNVVVDKLASAKGTIGTWEIFETSAKDGSETVLHSFKVRFLQPAG